MRAVVCEALGDPTTPLNSGVLSLKTLPEPDKLPPGHIRIQVAAASLNFADVLQVQGLYQVRPPLPFVPGSECAGVVRAVGAGVDGFAPGDRVCAVTQGGAFAEVCVAPAAAAWRVPPGLTLAAAAAVPVAFGTTHLALVHRARLQAGQTLLVLGASGGVGTAAVLIGKALGARVVAVTSGGEKAAYVASLGADAVVDESQVTPQRPLNKLLRAAAPKGVDVVYDPVGGAALHEALKVVAWGAQYVVIGFAGGGIPAVKTNLLLVKNVTMHGVFWGSYMGHQPEVLRTSMADVLSLVASGRTAVRMHPERFPLVRVPDAMAVLMGRHVRGKVIIDVAEERVADSKL